jgi:hypothetical protein
MLNDGEHYLPDPMETAGTQAEKIQKSVDRARAQAHRLMHKTTAELRKLQTERRFRDQNAETAETVTDLPAYGLADTQSIARTPLPSTKPPVTKQTRSQQPVHTPCSAPTPPAPAETVEIVLAA